MKFKTILTSLVALAVLYSCSSTKKTSDNNKTMWVAGFKRLADNGAGLSKSMVVHKGGDLSTGEWQIFYGDIQGFTYMEGTMQKIKVKETRLDPKDAPADGSTIKYELVEVLDKKPDVRAKLNGSYTLATLNGAPLNRMVKAPTMNIDVTKMQISGNNGCNDYTASITKLGLNDIALSSAAVTQRACINKNVEQEFQQALNKVTSYTLDYTKLHFYDINGNELFTFLMDDGAKEFVGTWTLARLNGGPLNRMVTAPTIVLDLPNKKISGNNGCNDYYANIKQFTYSKIEIGQVATTKKACMGKNVEKEFDDALSKIKAYKLEGDNVTFFDGQNNELLHFIKN